jgi:hypothetical protein
MLDPDSLPVSSEGDDRNALYGAARHLHDPTHAEGDPVVVAHAPSPLGPTPPLLSVSGTSTSIVRTRPGSL